MRSNPCGCGVWGYDGWAAQRGRTGGAVPPEEPYPGRNQQIGPKTYRFLIELETDLTHTLFTNVYSVPPGGMQNGVIVGNWCHERRNHDDSNRVEGPDSEEGGG